jgi:AraC-like DNA-binding protein
MTLRGPQFDHHARAVGAFDLIAAHGAPTAAAPSASLFTAGGPLKLAAAPRPRAIVHQFRLPGLGLGHVWSTGHRLTVSDPDTFTFLLPVEGSIRSSARGTDIVGHAGSLLAFPPDRRDTQVMPDGQRAFRSFALIVPRDRLVAAVRAGGLEAKIDLASFAPRAFGPAGHAAAAGLARLADLLASDVAARARSVQTAEGRAAWDCLIMARVLDLLAADDAPAPAMHPRARRALVDRALAYIHAEYASISTAASIAEACGVSLRTLETAFRDEVHATPTEMLRRLRLDLAHAMLSQGQGQSVTEIALACGFGHLGRFAGAYRARFGLAPSNTRRSG